RPASRRGKPSGCPFISYQPGRGLYVIRRNRQCAGVHTRVSQRGRPSKWGKLRWENTFSAASSTRAAKLLKNSPRFSACGKKRDARRLWQGHDFRGCGNIPLRAGLGEGSASEVVEKTRCTTVLGRARVPLVP